VAATREDARNVVLRGLSVLVVDDDPAIGAQLLRGLERTRPGHRHHVASH
jgi:hypothetical protein